MLNRRSVVGGLLAVPVAFKALASEPLPAITPNVVEVPKGPTFVRSGYPQHPIFGAFPISEDMGIINTLEVRYIERPHVPSYAPPVLIKSPTDIVGRKVAIEVNKTLVSAADGTYRSLVEAENALLAKLTAPHRSVCKRGLDMTGVTIIRAANRIAFMTRRGMGNTMLIHRSDLRHITDENFHPNFVQRRIGRWVNVGNYAGRINVWTTDHAPPSLKPGYGLVGYRGPEMDAGAYLVEFPGSRFGIHLPTDRGPDGGGYFQMVGLTRAARLPYLDPALS